MNAPAGQDAGLIDCFLEMLAAEAGAAPNTLAGIMKTSIPYGVALGIGGLLALALELAGYVQVTV